MTESDAKDADGNGSISQENSAGDSGGRRDAPESSPATAADASSDFVEHLRTVHFALVALALTLIILAFPSSSRMPKALTQIAQLTDLNVRWEEITKRWAMNAAHSLGLTFDNAYLVELKRDANRNVTAMRYIAPQVVPGKFSHFIEINGYPFTEAPKTIYEFEGWWNGIMAYGLNVLVPDHPYAYKKRQCSALGYVGERHKSTREVPLSCRIIPNGEYSGPPPPGVTRSQFTYFNSEGFIQAHADALAELPAPSGADISAEVFITVPLKIRTLNQEGLGLYDWTSGPFHQVFFELSTVPEDLKSLPLAEARSRIEALQPKSEQIIEVVGLKLPIVELMQWGTVLLVATQLYFWLHLRELVGRLALQSAPGNVAWIGIYGSRLARHATVVTTAVMPILAMSLLFSRGFYEIVATGDRNVPDFVLLGVATLCSLAGYLIARQTFAQFLALHASLRGTTSRG